MVAFEITINGKPYCESEDITVLTMVVEEIQRRGGQRISLHASGASEGPLQFLAANLGVGDEIVVRIVEASEGAESGPAGAPSAAGRSTTRTPSWWASRRVSVTSVSPVSAKR